MSLYKQAYKNISVTIKFIFIFLFIFISLVSALFLLVVHLGSQSSGEFLAEDQNLIFTDGFSIKTGGTLKIYLNSDSDLQATIFRLSDIKEPVKQIQLSKTKLESTFFDYKLGLQGKPSHSISLQGLDSGYYILETSFSDNTKGQIPFVVHDVQCRGIQIIAPTNTWLAYNHFIRSNYRDKRAGKVILSDRVNNIVRSLTARTVEEKTKVVYLPYAQPAYFSNTISNHTNPSFPKYGGHLVELEWELIKYLHTNDISYCVVDDRNLALGQYDLSSSMFVFNGHSEYWSDRMLHEYDRLVDNNKKILFTGGNNMYREVSEYEEGVAVTTQQFPASVTGTRIGTYYDPRGYKTYAPMKIIISKHWLFNGITETYIGARSWASENSNAFGSGVSGHETDKITRYSDGFEVLARGTNGGGFSGADMVFKKLKDSGWIINFSSLAFMGGIDFDKNVEKILHNIFMTEQTNQNAPQSVLPVQR